jgi:hypothetical protein
MGEPAVAGGDLEVSADEQPGLEKTTAEGQAVLGVGVQGHDARSYNGVFRRVGLHEGQPRLEMKVIGGPVLHLYYHGPSAAWRLKNSFTPEEAGCKSWIASASGALPAGLQTWQTGKNSAATDGWAELPLTLTLLVRHNPAPCPPPAAC